jgi:hypothetical protein
MNVIYDNSYMIDYLLKNGYKPNPSGNMSVDSSQDPKDLHLLAGEGEFVLIKTSISRLNCFGLIVLILFLERHT